MKTGNRVKMSPMWKHKRAVGTIIKITKDYTVVKWDDVPGEWHYTQDQSIRLEVLDEPD